MSFVVPERFRVVKGRFATSAGDGNNGVFLVTLNKGTRLKVIASDGEGWEHVSVSRDDRCPLWSEMCAIKDLFWNHPDDVVIQYHPRASEYVSWHQFCLHLWRPVGVILPEPRSIMVGPVGVSAPA